MYLLINPTEKSLNWSVKIKQQIFCKGELIKYTMIVNQYESILDYLLPIDIPRLLAFILLEGKAILSYMKGVFYIFQEEKANLDDLIWYLPGVSYHAKSSLEWGFR